MALVCIGFILAMSMLENGPMGRVMGVEFIPVRMAAAMLGNSNGVLSMGSATTISGNLGNMIVLLNGLENDGPMLTSI